MNTFRFFSLVLVTIFIGCSACEQDAAQGPEGTVYVRLASEPDLLNPLKTTNGYSRYVYEQIFLPLLRQDPQSLELVPALAKAAPTITPITDGPNEGGVAYSFELFEEAEFTEGQPVTGDDVAFTLKCIFNPGGDNDVYKSYFSMVKGIEVDADNPKRFTIYTGDKYFLTENVLAALEIYPKYIYDPTGLMDDVSLADMLDAEKAAELAESNEKLSQFATQFGSGEYGHDTDKVIGSGPYKLESWEAGQNIKLVHKDNWWGDKVDVSSSALLAYPKELIYRIIPDASTAVTAIKDEYVDVTNAINANDFIDLRGNDFVNEKYNLLTPAALNVYYIAFNNRIGKLDDKRVRRAIAHLVDIDAVIENLFQGLAQPVTVPFHPSKSYYDKSLQPIDFNLTKAQNLLQEAGWEDSDEDGTLDKLVDGERIALELDYLAANESTFGKNLAVYLQENAKRAGIKINVITKDFRTIMGEDVGSREFEMFGGGFGLFPTDTDPRQSWHTDGSPPGGGNRSGFGNAHTDSLITAIRSTIDRDERKALYLELQQIIYDEQPMVFLFAPQERLAIHKRFQAEPSVLSPGYFPNAFLVTDLAQN